MAENNINTHQPMNSLIELQPSSSSSPAILPSSSTSSISSPPLTNTSTTSSPSNNKAFLTANHFQLLMQENTDGIAKEVTEGTDIGELVQESDRSTALHVVASVGQSERMLDYIVSQSSNLLCTPNCKGDLPAHVATRSGHLQVLQNLVALANRQDENTRFLMLKKENDDKNTCLHIALEKGQMDISKFLFENCPQTFCFVNGKGFSPLYLAIKAEFWELVEGMVNREDTGDLDPDVELLKGKSVVHASIMAKNAEILKRLLIEYPELIHSDHSIDEKGRRALSYAADIGFVDGVKTILSVKDKAEKDFQNEAFKRDEDGCFPIHMACKGGNIQVVKELLNLSKRMRWLLDNEGQSILHVAAASGKADIVKHLIKQPKLATMMNMQDFNGYTPLHLAVKGKHPHVVYDLTWDSRINLRLQSKDGSTALDIAEDYGDVPSFEERLTWLALKYVGVPKARQVPLSNIELENTGHVTVGELNFIPGTTLNITEQGCKAKFHPEKKGSKYKDLLNTLLIIATLVVTVTYASGFTVPGSYNNDAPDKGMAALVYKHAFQVYVISNTIAMHSAILAIVILIWVHLDDLRLTLMSLDFALALLGIALIMMSVAFIAGLYMVLHDLVWLHVVVLVTGGVFLGVLLVFFIPLFQPMSCIKRKILRYVFHVPFKLTLLASEQGKREV